MEFHLNPADFSNDDELVRFIVESVIKPVIEQQVGTAEEAESIQGVAFLFGGPVTIPTETTERIQRLVAEGMSPEYVIREMTDLDIRRRREVTYAGFTVHYIEVEPRHDDVPVPTAEALAQLFALESDDPPPSPLD